MFALEAIPARHGDCFLLHWDDGDVRRTGLIDGGPDLTYSQGLRPRLQALSKERAEERLVLDFVMVSHLDSDHIAGVIDLFEDAVEDPVGSAVDVGTLWFNSLEGLLDESLRTIRPVATAAMHQLQRESERFCSSVLASIPQGQMLQGLAKKLGIAGRLNEPFDRLIVMDDAEEAVHYKGLKFTVLSPRTKELEELRKSWKKLRKDSVQAALTDRSVYNLSSIVVIVEKDDRKMLLTGDARADQIVEGLRAKGLLTEGRAHFDLMKLPHHGSRNSVDQNFFEQITADRYVVSGDQGRFPNPHEEAMAWLKAARGSDRYEVFCPYELATLRDTFADLFIASPPGQVTAQIP